MDGTCMPVGGSGMNILEEQAAVNLIFTSSAQNVLPSSNASELGQQTQTLRCSSCMSLYWDDTIARDRKGQLKLKGLPSFVLLQKDFQKLDKSSLCPKCLTQRRIHCGGR